MDESSDRFDSLRALLRRVYREPPPMPADRLWPRIQARRALRGRGPAGHAWRRALPRLAAAMLLFTGGIATGFGLARRAPELASVGSARDQEVGVPADVQRRGAEYVRAIAAVAALPADRIGTRQEGRQIALATLAGASREFLRLDPADSTALEIFHGLSAAWLGQVPTDAVVGTGVRF